MAQGTHFMELAGSESSTSVGDAGGRAGRTPPPPESPLAELFPEPWRMAARALAFPEWVAHQNDDVAQACLRAINQEGLAPLYAHAALAAWPEGDRNAEALNQFQAEVSRAKARHAVMALELGLLLDRFQAANLSPILVKGCDLALRIYREPYLRPMGDIDLLFETPDQAEQASHCLIAAGYRPLGARPGGHPWDWGHHMPDLRSPSTGMSVELHGSIIYPPHDRRWRKVKDLMQYREAWTWEGRAVTSLRDEANIVYLLAHTFSQHPGEPPRLLALVDSAKILERESSRFSWQLALTLAGRCGLKRAFRQGVAGMRALLAVDVPVDVLASLDLGDPGAFPKRLRFGGGEHPLVWAAKDLLYVDGPRLVIRKMFRTAFPSAAFLGFRYPEWRGQPLLAQYIKRWKSQALNLSRALLKI